jgi:hypothetical protein
VVVLPEEVGLPELELEAIVAQEAANYTSPTYVSL